MVRKADTTNTANPSNTQAAKPPTFDVNDPAFQAIVAQAVLKARGIDLIAADSPSSFLDDTPTARLIR